MGGVCYRLKQGSTLDQQKNIAEVYGTNGGIKTAYTYTPYGLVTASGNTTQPLQWSSEYTDLGLVYYNYRHCNPLDGRWTGRDPSTLHLNIHAYCYLDNRCGHFWDYLGLVSSLHAGIMEGLTAGTISVEDAIALLGGVAALTTLLQSRGRRLRCKPCIPAVGTMMEQKHTTHTHAGMCPHFHIFEVNQSRIENGCQCFSPRDRKGFSESQGVHVVCPSNRRRDRSCTVE